MSIDLHSTWRPNADHSLLRARAELLHAIRSFFAVREVLEVETPVLSGHATVDRHIESFAVDLGGATGYLQTSPEFAMKRLLCAQMGSIYQVAKVFRREEAGRWHNPEFSLLEWYRVGFDHWQLIDEVFALMAACGVEGADRGESVAYNDAFQTRLGIHPLTASVTQLRAALVGAGVEPPPGIGTDETDRDLWLDLLMSYCIAPQLGQQGPCALHSFPASQAALARVSGGVAERFEVIWKGVELANGFHELADADEQRRRFELEQGARRQRGDADIPPYDAHLIAALQQGLPGCAGVALGLDRLLMLLHGRPRIAEVLSFEFSRA